MFLYFYQLYFFFNFFKIFFQSLTKTFLKWKTKIWLLHRPLFRLCLFETRSDLRKWTRSASLPSVSAPFVSRLTPVNLWFITQNSYCIWCWSQGRKQTLTLTPRSLQFAPYLAHRHACVVIICIAARLILPQAYLSLLFIYSSTVWNGLDCLFCISAQDAGFSTRAPNYISLGW